MLSSACGARQAPPPAEPEPVAAAARPDPCTGYMRLVGPFLLRFEGALEDYQVGRADGGTTSRADAARVMADFVDQELPDMRRVRARDPGLAEAHTELVGSLEQLVGALEQLSTAYVLDDRRLRIRALDRVDLAWRRWSDAGMTIHGMCAPEDDAPTS